MKGIDVERPSAEQVEAALKKWNTMTDYVEQEKALDELFCGSYKSNDNLTNILIKCSALNDFYSTNIFKVYPVALHIKDLDIDNRLKNADTSLVNDIAIVDITDKNGVTKSLNFYSFASKYCSHHNPEQFPIYDSYVHKVLNYFKRQYKDFKFAGDLKNYDSFKQTLLNFQKYFGIEQYTLKELDKYLWLLGKEYFPISYKKAAKKNSETLDKEKTVIEINDKD